MTSLAQLEDTDVIAIEAWRDPVVEALGHDPRSLYVETFWLPVLGPSATWLLRRFAACLESNPQGCTLALVEMSRSLGLGDRAGRNAPFMRTVARTVDFAMARIAGPRALAVRTTLPPLARRHLLRLPPGLRAQHDRYESAAAEHPARTASDEVRRRARQLALSLADLGEDGSGIEHQLVRWRFHPSTASECAAWAIEARARGPLAAAQG